MPAISTNISTTLRRRFEKRLVAARQSLSETSITSRFPWQATLSVLELLDYAQVGRQSIRIITGSATEQFYQGEIARAMEDALRERCDILLLRLCAKDYGWNESLGRLQHCYASHTQDSGRMQLASLDLSKEEVERYKIPHFLLVGDSAYRIEERHAWLPDIHFTETEPETNALVCFNDETTGTSLKTFFNRAFKLARKEEEQLDLYAPA